MKKERLFGKFYLESLRQTRIVGIIFTVILAAASLSMTLGQYISDLSHYLQLSKTITGHPFGPVVLTFQELNPLQGILTFIMAPLLALMAFSFLNKRASSDFYHSVTQTRGEVFLSYSLSCITWLIFAAVVSTLAGLIAALCCNGYYIINWSTFIFLAERLVSAFYVAGATALAMTLTGTLLNNILVTGMILFVPRILMGVIASAILSEVSVLPGIEQLGLLDPRYNLVCGDILFVFDAIGDNSKYSILPLVYTAVIGVIYFILAYIAFRVRPSESAGQSAPSRFLQAAYRIAFTTVICSIACVLIFGILDDSSVNTDNIILVVIIYVFALIAWFVYELVTTRKPSNLLRSLPSLSIVVVLNVGLILTMTGIKSGVERFRPEPEDIEYIKVFGEDYDFYSNGYMSLYDYLIGDISEAKIVDDRVNEIVSKNLIESINRDGYYFADSILSSSYQYTEIKTITVGIKTNSGLKYRCFDIPISEAEVIYSVLNETILGERGLNELPETKDIYTDSYQEITDEQFLELYDVLKNEISTMDKDRLLEIVSSNNDAINYFSVYTTYGFEELGIQIPISIRFEKTVQKYFELIDSEDKVKSILLNDPDEFDNLTETHVNLDIYDNGSVTHTWSGSLSELIDNGMFNILSTKVDEAIDPYGMMVFLNISFYDEDKDEYNSESRYISLSDIKMIDLPLEIRTGLVDY